VSALLRLALAGIRGGNRAVALATVLVAALATTGIVAGLTVRSQASPLVDRAYREAGRPDLVVYGEPEVLERLRRDPAFVAASPVVRYVGATVPLRGEPVEARIDARTGDSAAPGRPLLRDGRWPTPNAPDEVVFDQAAAATAGLRVGDRVDVRVAGRTATLTVVGTAVDLTDCFHPDCDPIRLLVDPAALARLAPDPARWDALVVGRLAEPADADGVAARLLDTAGVDTTQTWGDTRDDLLIRDRLFGASLAAFGLVVLLAAGFVAAGTATARLLARRREIALLAAVGYTGRQLVAGLVGETLLLGAAGVLAGGVAGGLLAPYLQVGLADGLGRPGPRVAPALLLGSAAAVALILAAATLLPAWRAVRHPAVEALRDHPPRTVTPARLARLVDRLPLDPAHRYGLGVVLARPGRSALTVGTLAVAVAALVVGAGFAVTLTGLTADPARAGEPYDAVVVPTHGADPAELAAALSTAPEVAGWYSRIDRPARLGDQTFLSRAVGGDPGHARFVIREGRALRAAGEAIVGYGLLRRLDLRIGDTVTVRAGDTPLTLTVVGWYLETEDAGELLLYRAEQLPGTPPDAFLVSGHPGGTPRALAAALRDRLGTSATVRARETDPDDLRAFTTAMRLMTALVLAVGLAHLGAAMLAGARERSRALGVLRAVGFTVRQSVIQSAAGGAALGLVAGLVGLPVGLLAHRVLADRVTVGLGVGPGLAETPPAALLGAIVPVSVLAGAVVGALTAGRLARRPASELVRGE